MIYDLLAPFYDAINSEVDYGAWADFIEELIRRELKKKPELVLDLACGTGKMTIELSRRGYDMTGVDYSPEMLDRARGEAEAAGQDILWLCQDITEFELYGTVDLIISLCDSLNYITDADELSEVFRLVNNYLESGGIFCFDMNSEYKFENVYADNAYVLEDEGIYCGWQNAYDPETRLCQFYLSLFEQKADGSFTRADEVQTERCYELDEIKAALARANLELLGVWSDFDDSPANDTTERWYFAARAIK